MVFVIVVSIVVVIWSMMGRFSCSVFFLYVMDVVGINQH